MRRKHAWFAWAALITGAIWVTRRSLQSQGEHHRLPADFDDHFFLQEAAELGRRERNWASHVIRASSNESLRTLARMSLAQHQAADGVWAGFGTEFEAGENSADQDHITVPTAAASPDQEYEMALTLQRILDEAWPLFDGASQHSHSPTLRDRSLRMLAWLEEAEQTLARIIESLTPDPP